MNRVKTKPANRVGRRANIVRHKVFSVEELANHIDPGSREEAEEFARFIYRQRQQERERTLPE